MSSFALFKSVLGFDLRYNLKKPTLWIYFSIFFLLSFLFVVTDAVQIGGSVGMIHRNAPTVIGQIFGVMTLVSTIFISGIAGTAVIRDIEFKSHELFFTTRLTKSSYIGGRFLGSIISMLVIYLSIPLALILGTLLGPIFGWIPPEKVGEFSLWSYVNSYLIFTVPNTLFIGALFFGAGLLFRNFVAVYVQGIALFSLYSVAQTLVSDIDNKTLAALLDPFGIEAFSTLIRYWTPAEQNTVDIPFTGNLLINRLVWIAVSFLIFGVTYWLFSFSSQGLTLRKKKSRASSSEESSASTLTRHIPTFQRNFGWRASFAQFRTSVRFYYFDILRSAPFLAITLIGLVTFLMNALNAGKMYDTGTYPVTYTMISEIRGFTIFALITIIFYSAELVWRERGLKLDQIHDALSASNVAVYTGKITSLWLLVSTLYVVLTLMAMAIQASKGYTNFEIDLYISSLLFRTMPLMLEFVLLSFAIQSFYNNKYLGHFIVIGVYVAEIVFSQVGLEHPLWKYANNGSPVYSDMNGFTPYIPEIASYTIHSIVLGLLLATLGYMARQFGTETSFALKIKRIRHNFSGGVSVIFSVLAISLLASGGWIWYHTNVLDTYLTEKDREKLAVQYENTYRAKFLNFPQPRIISTKIRVDLFPEERHYVSNVQHKIVNKTKQPIDSLIVNYDQSVKLERMTFSREATLVLQDTLYGLRVYKFSTPLQPGDTAEISYSMAYIKRGFASSLKTGIVQNGSFLNNNDVAISLGYSESGELSDPDKRKKYGLPPRLDVPKLGDSLSRNYTYISNDADRIEFEAIISTSSDQIAIAPGYLQREWTAPIEYRPDLGNRKFYYYKMDSPILNFYSFLSGRYAVKRDVWKNPQNGNEVALEIYYHPTHPYNLDKMLDASKRGLEYFSENFSPYQHRQFRIIEFPRYASFAQAFPNTIPFSESIGFIARLTGDEDEIDFTYFVTAHELAHQWWAHQVIGAAQEGSTLLSESLAEYSALMVMKHFYGEHMMRRFLKHELDDYLRGRASERKSEQPLISNRNQQYIHYNKGSHVLYSLADYIGEKELNSLLARYIQKTAYQSAPYTNAREFVDLLQAGVPDSLKFVISDMFEKITIYDNRAEKARATKNTDGTYTVHFDFSSAKMYADSTGKETSQQIGDYIDVGIFAENRENPKQLGSTLLLKKMKISSTKNSLSFVVKQLPKKIGIDPYNKLIDRNSDDNVITVEQ